MALEVVQLALPLLVAVVVVALVGYTTSAGNRAARWRGPVPSAARWAAGIAGVIWILAAFGFGFLALAMFGGVAMGYSELGTVAVVSVVATPATFLLGLLLFAPGRRVLVWSIVWAAITAIFAAWPDVGLGAFAGLFIVPTVAGLLSLIAWMRFAPER